jgi:diadenosine tetraphosphate (Ap4A) HIT family hydrolase
VTKLNEMELLSLWKLMAQTKSALNLLFKPDHYNYVFLMNVQPHLHGHIIPRYARTRNLFRREFKDGQIGSHYSLTNINMPPIYILRNIAELISKTLVSIDEVNE